VNGQRKALIVANDEYEHEGLKHLLAPAADAQALAGVLGDAQIGDFDVHVVRNEPAHVIEGQIEDIFSDSRPDDVLLLHFSCHGLKSESGELFFAARNTRPNRLGSTAVSADFVQRCMRASRSRSIVLLLDCCYGGAFSQGVTVRASGDVNVLDSFAGGKLGGGRGRAVITASSAMEYAFEGDRLADDHSPQPSVFTSALVEGLATGDADRDQDGWVSLNELYEYVFDKVREQNPHQTPSRDVEMQGELYLARRSRPVSTPAPLPAELQDVIDHPLASIRAGAVQELARLLHGRHAGKAQAARTALEHLANDDSRMVAAAASTALAGASNEESPATVRTAPPGESDLPPVKHEAPPAARLELSASVLDFGQLLQHGEPGQRTVRLGSPGGGPLDAWATTDAGWLDLRLDDDQLSVVADTTDVGDHDGLISIDSNAGPGVIRVHARVDPPAAHNATQAIPPEAAEDRRPPDRRRTSPASTGRGRRRWRPGIRVSIAALAVAAVAVIVAANLAKHRDAGQREYTAPGGVSVRTDDGWTLDGSGSPPNVRDYRAPGATSKMTGTYFRIGIDDDTPPSSLTEVLDVSERFLKGPDSPYHEVKILGKQLTGDTCGVPAGGIIFTGVNESGVPRHVFERLMLSNGTTKILQLDEPNSSLDRSHAIRDQLIDSCRIT